MDQISENPSFANESHVRPRGKQRQENDKNRSKERHTSDQTKVTRRNSINDCIDERDIGRAEIEVVDLKQRCVFTPVPPLPLATWQEAVDKLASLKGASAPRRISPSKNHLLLQHKAYNQAYLRQVKFSPSVSLHSDPFVPSEVADSQKEFPRDGRYRALDPLSIPLPKPAPTLSHRKRRLPTRADVGFPDATAEEIQQKQDEIRNETLWEETSPRVALLLTSDSLGSCVVTAMPKNKHELHIQWNGGGVHDIPYAGRELLEALQRNARHFNREFAVDSAVLRPSPYSMLAPPLEATHSSSQEWRSRPFHDRPVGMKYLVCHQSRVRINGNENAKMMCSMALYVFSSENEAINRKISEEFWAPCGEGWKKSSVSKQATVWSQRKSKGIFSFDANDLLNGGSLHLVLKVYRVTRVERKDLLQPICFGLTAVPIESKWPNIQQIDVPFIPYDNKSFVDAFGSDKDVRREHTPKKPRQMLFKSQTKANKNTHTIEGSSAGLCTIQVSSLDSDLLQCLLVDSAVSSMSKAEPRFLVDSMGDCAVAAEPSNDTGTTVRKRSALVRMPNSSAPGGYTSLAELREVCYMPCQSGNVTFLDCTHSWRSHHNVLFLYPRVLKLESNSKSCSSVTLRFRLSYTPDENQTSVSVVDQSFYCPMSWSEESLADEAYSCVENWVKVEDGETAAHFNDEVKLRLPSVLCGSSKLIVSVFVVENTQEEGTRLQCLAETIVPVSSSAPREKSSLGRVATVIPNRNHRLKLGEFRLQLESRLSSAIHVTDGSVAASFRDYFAPSSTASEVISPTKISLDQSASGSLLGQFDSLLHVNMLNLTNKGITAYCSAKGKDSLQALCVQNAVSMLCKARSRFQNAKEFQLFIKKHVDTLDLQEGSDFEFHLSSSELSENKRCEDGCDLGTKSPEPHSLFRVRQGLNMSSARVTKVVRALQKKGAPFTRVALGITKTDVMRVEAELLNDETTEMPFFDDDETIATVPTTRRNDERKMDSHDTGVFDIVVESSTGPDSLHDASFNSYDGAHFSNRMRTVARVMLAPCVGPSIGNILAEEESGAVENVKLDEEADAATVRSTSFEGEEDNRHEAADTEAQEVYPNIHSTFTFTQSNSVPNGFGDYLYETIIVIWLRAWLDHVQRVNGGSIIAFPVPKVSPMEASVLTVMQLYSQAYCLLSLCLKSMVLRFRTQTACSNLKAPRVVLDELHMRLLEPFVELLARGAVGVALVGIETSESVKEDQFLKAISAGETVLDFLVGCASIVHSTQFNLMLRKYFSTLRDCETEHMSLRVNSGYPYEWNEESLIRVRTCRHLRIRAIEVFAALPNYVASQGFSVAEESSSPAHQAQLPSWFDQKTKEHVHWSGRAEMKQSLGKILCDEGLAICSLSCESVVAEATAHIEVTRQSPHPSSATILERPGAALKRDDLVMLQSIGIHAITTVYELMVRRQTLDKRYQSSIATEKMCHFVALSVLDKSLAAVKWLARLEATHRARYLWLCTVLYVLQEASGTFIRTFVQSCCAPETLIVHRFVRLLRLCCNTFHGSLESDTFSLHQSMADIKHWILQESFNTICATTIVIVEEALTTTLQEQEKVMGGILDLLIHVLTTPQSPVTHLRAVGGALQALECFGIEAFVSAAGHSLQNLMRLILSLMNSTSLSVRSIAVDFIISLFGRTFSTHGNIYHLSSMFASVLPEVAAREVGLYSIGGLVVSFTDACRVLWPLRRSLADIQDTNPLDDDRVDSVLSTELSVFCRSCQAVLDGVLVEIRLRKMDVVGTKLVYDREPVACLDADEESLLEASMFFHPETHGFQRVRWLLSLRRLHEFKAQWAEAAETLFECASTVVNAIPNLLGLWRPSTFNLWSDAHVQPMGEMLNTMNGSGKVMEFATQFLHGETEPEMSELSYISKWLVSLTKDAVALYKREQGWEHIAYAQVERLHRDLSTVVAEAHQERTQEDEIWLRQCLVGVSKEISDLAQYLLKTNDLKIGKTRDDKYTFVLLQFSGKKPRRFVESTSLPPFVEWDTPIIVRFSQQKCRDSIKCVRVHLEKLQLALALATDSTCNVVVKFDGDAVPNNLKSNTIVVNATTLSLDTKEAQSDSVRRFTTRRTRQGGGQSLVQMTVPFRFPYLVSRQKILIQRETMLASHQPFFT